MLAVASTEASKQDMGRLAMLLSILQCSALVDSAAARSCVATLVLPGVLRLAGTGCLSLDCLHNVSSPAAAFILLCCHKR